MAVRRVAMARFGERNIRAGEPIALLQERFAPVYFIHRFALNSLAKTIGGMEYSNAVRGDGQQATRPIDGRRAARGARAAARRAAAGGARDPGHGAHAARRRAPIRLRRRRVELFGSRTRPAFDELGAARTLAQMIVDGMLQRERAARLVQFAVARCRCTDVRPRRSTRW